LCAEGGERYEEKYSSRGREKGEIVFPLKDIEQEGEGKGNLQGGGEKGKGSRKLKNCLFPEKVPRPKGRVPSTGNEGRRQNISDGADKGISAGNVAFWEKSTLLLKNLARGLGKRRKS